MRHRWKSEAHEPHMECQRRNGLWCAGSNVMKRSIEALELGKVEEVNKDTGGQWEFWCRRTDMEV